jgi:UDP-glucose 4-epimerase
MDFNRGPTMDKQLSGKVLVTGGAGFIGSELVRQLAAQGYTVLVVDNLVNGKRENLEDAGPQVDLIVADIRDARSMALALKGVCAVFHLACLGVRHSIHSPAENHAVNATATLQLLQLSRAAGVLRFTYVSSSEVYGTARLVPMTESHPTFPLTVYGASKLAGECYTRAFHETYGFPTVVVRPFNSYGPRCHHEGDCGEVIPKFLLRSMAGRPIVIFGDGEQTRDFTFVADTARGILQAGLAERTLGQTLNLGSGMEISIEQLAHEVATVAGHTRPKLAWEPPRPGDVRRLYADSSTARRLVGFEPRVRLREGLTRLRDWYLAREVSCERLLQDERVRNWEIQGVRHEAA